MKRVYNQGMNALVVGSSVIDLFLNVKNNSHTHVVENTVSLELGDKIPVGIDALTLGGNGANVSVGLARLGIQTTFFTYLGADILSTEIEQKIKEEGIKLLSDQKSHKNTSLAIILDFDADRVILSHHEVHEHGFSYTGGGLPHMVYLTSIGNVWEHAYQAAIDFCMSHNIPYAFSPGSYQMDDLNETCMNALKTATLLFVNREEAQKLTEKLGIRASDIKSLLFALKHHGPELVSITDGKNGGYCIDQESHVYTIPAFPENSSIEKTGAGDSYATGFLASYLQGNSAEESMRWGTLNANAVMQHIGAQAGLLTKQAMQELLLKYSKFRAQKIS